MLAIRKAGLNDIDKVQGLAHTIWPVVYKDLLSPDQLKYMMGLIYSKQSLINQATNLHHQFILVYDNDKAVGFASYSTVGTDRYRLQKIYVLPDQHGKGIGKYIVNYIIEEIKPAGTKILELTVKRDNIAVEFYKKLGFTISKEIDMDIGHGYFMRDYLMELTL